MEIKKTLPANRERPFQYEVTNTHKKKHASEETLYKIAKNSLRVSTAQAMLLSINSSFPFVQCQHSFIMFLCEFSYFFSIVVLVIELWTSNELWHMRTNFLMSFGVKISKTHHPHSIPEARSIWAASAVASIQHKAPQKTGKNSSKQKQNNKFS